MKGPSRLARVPRVPIALLGAGALALLVGCGGPPGPRPPALARVPRSAADVAGVIRERSESVTTLRAGLKIAWEDPATGEVQSCAGLLSYARPGRMRLRGTSAAFFTVFELVAGPETIWLDVPREGFTVVGPRSDPGWARLPLSPARLLVALLADPCPGGPCLDGDLQLERRGEDFALTAPDWVLVVEGRTGLPLLYERTDGGLEVSWADWALRRGIPWPHAIEVRGGDLGVLRIRAGRIQPGRRTPEALFSLELEPGREILTPEEARERWLLPGFEG